MLKSRDSSAGVFGRRFPDIWHYIIVGGTCTDRVDSQLPLSARNSCRKQEIRTELFKLRSIR